MAKSRVPRRYGGRGTATRSGSEGPERLFDLTGRVAVITGGAGFLGRQHAEIITAFGGIAVIVDRDATAAKRAVTALCGRDREALAVPADLRRRTSVNAMVRRVMKRFGRIDILINNAAMTIRGGGRVARYFSTFEEYPLELWREALEVNLTGMFLVTQAVGRVMVRQRRGVVVNMASDLGLIAPDHRIYEGETFNSPASYSVSKAGVIGFTRYLATYWAKHQIRVNALAPAGMFDGHSPRFVRKLSALIPMGRMAAPNEYQGAVLFLASDASSFTTGSTLVVDGGRTCW
jgi:NAD(P)-dependent dehydrogenase (short-subunit alcohol dehydrogenase family)